MSIKSDLPSHLKSLKQDFSTRKKSSRLWLWVFPPNFRNCARQNVPLRCIKICQFKVYVRYWRQKLILKLPPFWSIWTRNFQELENLVLHSFWNWEVCLQIFVTGPKWLLKISPKLPRSVPIIKRSSRAKIWWYTLDEIRFKMWNILTKTTRQIIFFKVIFFCILETYDWLNQLSSQVVSKIQKSSSKIWLTSFLKLHLLEITYFELYLTGVWSQAIIIVSTN